MGRKILAIAGLATLAAFVFGGSPATATDGLIIHPCWDIDKSAVVHGVPGEVTDLDLTLGQSIQIDYSVAVTKRECREGEIPNLSVDVFDTFAGTLAIHLDHSQTFTYSRTITAETCDSFNVENTATVVDSVVLDSDTVNIHVTVHCDQGCTLTQGYWKTHSNQGPAPLDDTWNLLPSAELTAAFLPNVDADGDPGTWYSIFWTAPAGNFYYQLAHQFMAAKLNILNGASSTAAVDAAIAGAEGFFANFTPAEAGALSKQSATRTQALGWASTLGSYNEGAIGPGHCDEDHHS